MKALEYQPAVDRRAGAHWAEQVGDAASCEVESVTWVESEAPRAFALAEAREDVVESLLVVSAIAVVAHWQANEVAELLMPRAPHD